MNILYIGSSGALSLTPFKRLLTSAHNLVAVGVYNPLLFDSNIIAFSPISLEGESLALSASQQSIPLIDLSQPVDDIVQQCNSFSIDVILMSCYGKRLPQEIIILADKGCFNMHPSLLPKYRGAEPVFWQMKAADDVGVSWHYVDAALASELDSGAIVAQQNIFLDDGMNHSEISSLAAAEGTDLMISFLAKLSDDELVSTKQDNEHASYQSYPRAEDFVVDLSQTAQHTYNFMKATETFGYHYQCKIGSHIYLLDKSLDYENNDSLVDVEVKVDVLYIPCNEGVLIASFTGKL